MPKIEQLIMKKCILTIILMLLFGGKVSTNVNGANLKRYAAMNEQLKKSPTVVFLGNSITDFWVGHTPKFFSDNNFVDRGISGETSAQIYDRFQQDVVALHPKVVVILAGINDIAENQGPVSDDAIMNNISKMVNIAQKNKIIPVLCSILPCSHFEWRPNLMPAKRVVRMNKLIKAYANKNRIAFVNYYPLMVDKKGGMKSELSADGCHPNDSGYLIMNNLVIRTIAKALGTNPKDYTIDK